MRYTVRPISDRTQFTGRHTTNPFSSSWTSTLEILERELRALSGKEIVMEVDVSDRDIRLDRMLRGDARPSTPGVRLCFESKHGPLAYGTDRFYSWQANVRAIALGLEALRKVDRYGISRRGEQYAGWKQLPPGTGATQLGGMTADQAREIIMDASMDGPLIAWPAPHETERWRLAFTMARRRVHPDRRDGDRTEWDKVEQAARVLGIAS